MCPAPDDLRDSPAPRGSRPNAVADGSRLEELSYEECLALLRVSSVARLGVVVNGAPIVVELALGQQLGAGVLPRLPLAGEPLGFGVVAFVFFELLAHAAQLLALQGEVSPLPEALAEVHLRRWRDGE